MTPSGGGSPRFRRVGVGLPMGTAPGHRSVWPFAFALFSCLGVLFGGLNSFVGQDLIGIGDGLMIAAIAIIVPMPSEAWRRAWLPLTLLAAAFAWAVLGIAGAGGPLLAPDAARPALIAMAGYVAALLGGAMLGARRIDLVASADWLLLFGAATVLYALATGGGGEAFDPQDGRFLGTLANANASACLFAGWAGLAIARATQDGSLLWRARAALPRRLHALGQWLALVLMIGATALTGSRSGMVLLLLTILTVGGRALAARTGSRWLILLPVAALALVLAAGSAGVVLQRFGLLPQEAAVRLLIWRHNASIAMLHPVFGFGVGSFAAVNQHFLSDPATAQALWMTNSPHDIVLKLLIEGGVPYVLMLGGAFALIAVAIVARGRRRGMTVVEVAFSAMIGSIIASSLIDIALEVPAIAAATMSWIGLLWGRTLAPAPPIVDQAPDFPAARRSSSPRRTASQRRANAA